MAIDKTGDGLSSVSLATTIVNVRSGESVTGSYFAVIPTRDFEARRGDSRVKLPDPNSPDIYERPMFTHGEWLARRESDGK